MHVVKTSFRALAIALAPLAFLHGVLTAMALLGSLPDRPLIDAPAPDKVFGLYMGRLAIDALLILLGHYVLRSIRISTRLAYGAMGAIAGAVGYALALKYEFLFIPPLPGAMVTAGILPTMAAMLSGFLYGQVAGLEKLAGSKRQDETSEVNGKVISDTFDGPIRVRTSIPTLLMVSLVPAFFASLWAFFFVSMSLDLVSASGPASKSLIFAFGFPAQLFLVTALVTAPIAAITMFVTHSIARAFRRTRGRDYAVIGAIMGIAATLAMIPLPAWSGFPLKDSTIFFVPLAIFGAIMGAMYRRFAGIEPLPLPEPVLARDPDTLVGSDHPSRHTHTVVLNG